MKEFIKEELKGNWGKIALTVLIAIAVMYFAGDIRNFLNKKPTTLTQGSATQPIYINANGKEMSSAPPVYVNVTPSLQEVGTVGIIQKPTKDSADVVISDNKPVYKLTYNGKDYQWTSPIEDEQYKFEKGQVTYTRNTTVSVDVEVPQPRWAMGIGYGTSGYAIQADYRLGNSPFNVWTYADKNDFSAGLKFVQYASPTKKGGDKK